MPIRPEDVLKGRMAESLVNELLRACGNKVYRFGYETVLQNLTQLEQTFKKYTRTSKIIRSIPDLVVVNKQGEPFFVEVKFRKNEPRRPWFEKEEWFELKDIMNYWNAVLILVTTKKPYFLIFDDSTFKKGKNTFISIENDKKFNIKDDILQEFNRLVEKYYF